MPIPSPGALDDARRGWLAHESDPLGSAGSPGAWLALRASPDAMGGFLAAAIARAPSHLQPPARLAAEVLAQAQTQSDFDRLARAFCQWPRAAQSVAGLRPEGESGGGPFLKALGAALSTAGFERDRLDEARIAVVHAWLADEPAMGASDDRSALNAAAAAVEAWALGSATRAPARAVGARRAL